jgi:hypothetical protein
MGVRLARLCKIENPSLLAKSVELSWSPMKGQYEIKTHGMPQ